MKKTITFLAISLLWTSAFADDTKIMAELPKTLVERTDRSGNKQICQTDELLEADQISQKCTDDKFVSANNDSATKGPRGAFDDIAPQDSYYFWFGFRNNYWYTPSYGRTFVYFNYAPVVYYPNYYYTYSYYRYGWYY